MWGRGQLDTERDVAGKQHARETKPSCAWLEGCCTIKLAGTVLHHLVVLISLFLEVVLPTLGPSSGSDCFQGCYWARLPGPIGHENPPILVVVNLFCESRFQKWRLNGIS